MVFSFPAPVSVRTHRLDDGPEDSHCAPSEAARCLSCTPAQACRRCRLAAPDMAIADAARYTRKRLKRGDILHRAGGSCEHLFAIRSGFFKCSVAMEDGREQVIAFRMAGDVLGLDGIDNACHESQAVALEDSEVCIIAHAQLDAPDLQRWLYKVMSREMTRDHGVMLLLGRMSSEERLAVFLLDLSHRLAARGMSARDFHLRMTREEIGSYLGLSFETVSRLFSRFQDERLLEVNDKHILILDYETLAATALGIGGRRFGGRQEQARRMSRA